MATIILEVFLFMEHNEPDQAEKDRIDQESRETLKSRRKRRENSSEQIDVARIAWVTVCCLTLFACGVYMGLTSSWADLPPILTPDYSVSVGTQTDLGQVASSGDQDPGLTVSPGEEDSLNPPQSSVHLPQDSEDPAEPEDASQAISLVVDLDDLTWPCFGQITREPGWFYFSELGEWRYVAAVTITGESRRDVRAVLAGKISSITTDALWGKVLTIDHGSDIKTEYGGIDVPAIREGDQVSQGATIGNLTGQALTFSITKNGNAENPADYLTQAR